VVRKSGAIPLGRSLRNNNAMPSVHPRITIEADKRDGKPCIRGMRFTVNDVLGWLSHGMIEEEILEEHPGLDHEDFVAVYAFAADHFRLGPAFGILRPD
jgi:uncharacterized protein (DUF433 family)